MKLILLMILGHLIADYTLQGWLASAKQSEWWKKNAPDELYKYDWLMALLCHSLYWSILTFLPLYSSPLWAYTVLVNAALHAAVDHLKANARLINLWHDQLLHLAQIIATCLVLGCAT